MDLSAQDPVARRTGTDRSVAVVEQADVGGHEDAHPSVVRVDADMRRVLVGTELAELALDESTRFPEVVPLTDLHSAAA